MPQFHSQGVSPSQISKGLGYIPARAPEGGTDVSVTGGNSPVIDTATPIPPTVQFGTGAPVAAADEGAIYYDTTLATYAGYVYHSGAWHSF